MVTSLATHARFDLEVRCKGDLHVDAHHTVEDVGIALGDALIEALGDKKGIVRFGHAYVPLDEALSRCVVDLSGRPWLHFGVEWKARQVGTMPTELFEDFFWALADHGRLNLHLDNLRGRNAHHIAETLFKATARALRDGGGPRPAGQGRPQHQGIAMTTQPIRVHGGVEASSIGAVARPIRSRARCAPMSASVLRALCALCG